MFVQCGIDIDIKITMLPCTYHLGLNATTWPPSNIRESLSCVPLYPVSADTIFLVAIAPNIEPAKNKKKNQKFIISIKSDLKKWNKADKKT